MVSLSAESPLRFSKSKTYNQKAFRVGTTEVKHHEYGGSRRCALDVFAQNLHFGQCCRVSLVVARRIPHSPVRLFATIPSPCGHTRTKNMRDQSNTVLASYYPRQGR